MTQRDRDPLTIALEYAQRGCALHPLKGKKAILTDWPKRASTDPEQIRVWAEKYPNCNWGMVTGRRSGILAIDIDPRSGGDDTLGELEKEFGELPETIEVHTGKDGRHLYFAITPEEAEGLRTGAHSLGHGVDVKCNGGYVVIPGSIHDDTGKAYAFGVDGHPDEVKLCQIPPWVLAKLQPSRKKNTESGQRVKEEQIHEGQRNDHLASLAGTMRRRGMTPSEIEAALKIVNKNRCVPPLSEYEVRGIAESIGRYEPEFPFGDEGSATYPNGDGLQPNGSAARQTHDSVWPNPPDEAAFYGMAGEFVRMVGPISEGDPVAILLQFLVAFGSVVGRLAHFTAEQTPHYLNMFAVIVGLTSKARKGSSWSHVFRVIQACDPNWAKERVKSGLSSGEGLIWQVRDPIYKKEPVKEKGRRTGEYEEVCVDQGEDDKRLLVQEAEFSTVLRMTDRDGNTLSAIIRKAWETGDLEALTKNSPAKATAAHISLIGHIVKDEVLRYLSRTEAGNGFANRFLWVCAKRSKAICDEVTPDEVQWSRFVARLKSIIESARKTGELRRDEGAQEIWRKVYPTLSEGEPGLFGAVTSRAEAQVMRLACLYALLDRSSLIRAAHLLAALAVWEYSEASARFIFGDTLGDPIADEILKALRMNLQGLTRTQISELFGRNKNKDQIGRALATLLEHGRVHIETEETRGRWAERWKAI